MAQNVTIEELAEMIQRGFKETAKKEDMDQRFAEVGERFAVVATSFEGIHEELRDIKRDLGPLSRAAGANDREIASLKARIERLEQKLGLSN